MSSLQSKDVYRNSLFVAATMLVLAVPQYHRPRNCLGQALEQHARLIAQVEGEFI
jgi:hypothetical protein